MAAHLRLLLVDGDPATRQEAAALLETTHQVVSVPSTSAALAALLDRPSPSPFDVILIDAGMEPSAIPALVAAAATTRTPVIALAGPGAPPGAAVSALEAGAADVVGAPLRLADAALLWRHVWKSAGGGGAAAAAAQPASPPRTAPALLPLFTGVVPATAPATLAARAVRFAADAAATVTAPSMRPWKTTPSPGITTDTPPMSAHQRGGGAGGRAGTDAATDGEATGDEEGETGGPVSCEVSAAPPPPPPPPLPAAKGAAAAKAAAAVAAAAEDEEAATVAESLWALMRGPAAAAKAGVPAATSPAAAPAPPALKRAAPSKGPARPKAAKAPRIVAVTATAAGAALPAPPPSSPRPAAPTPALPPLAPLNPLAPHPLDDPAAPRTPAICAANRAAALAKFQAKKAAARAGGRAGGVRYESRRRLAVARPRVKGQFVTAEVAAAYHAAEADAKTNGGPAPDLNAIAAAVMGEAGGGLK